jgi:23S rRNA (pseudouridine1915-N3)-methyltransferase
MRLNIVWIGKTKDRNCAALVNRYVERIKSFVPIDICELKERSGSVDEKRIIGLECAKLIAALEHHDFVVLLDEEGRQFTSPELAELINRQQQSGIKHLTFVIGGFAGVNQEVKERADLKMALSRMTFTHELARVILAEQIYRALTLLGGYPYHRF